MQQKTISLPIDCCKVKCGINKEVSLQRPEKEFGGGCDIVITDRKYGYVYICKVKKGRITLEDARRALKQIEYCESKYRQKNVLRFFIHCGAGRLEALAIRFFYKNRILIARSSSDFLVYARSKTI